jgi:hypothetical protein
MEELLLRELGKDVLEALDDREEEDDLDAEATVSLA